MEVGLKKPISIRVRKLRGIEAYFPGSEATCELPRWVSYGLPFSGAGRDGCERTRQGGYGFVGAPPFLATERAPVIAGALLLSGDHASQTKAESET
jgi:hypothetical protein